jgi:hypothetical protein
MKQETQNNHEEAFVNHFEKVDELIAQVFAMPKSTKAWTRDETEELICSFCDMPFEFLEGLQKASNTQTPL